MEEEKKYKFVGYYKYSFSFRADDGESIRVGGNSDDIYRSSVSPVMTFDEIKREFSTEDMYINGEPYTD